MTENDPQFIETSTRIDLQPTIRLVSVKIGDVYKNLSIEFDGEIREFKLKDLMKND